MTDGLRKAALSLYALAQSDREWLLGNLPEPQRQRLENAVAELERAGVSEIESETIEIKTDAENPGSILGKATVEELCALLHEEPEWVIAAVLAHRDTRVQTQVREALGRRNQGGESEVTTLKPRAERAIADVAARKVVELRKASPGPFAAMLDSMAPGGTPKRRWWRILWSR